MRLKCRGNGLRAKSRYTSNLKYSFTLLVASLAAGLLGGAVRAGETVATDATASDAQFLIAQSSESGESGSTNEGTSNNRSQMSDRIRKYMGDEEGMPQGSQGGAFKGGGRMERMRERMNDMTPEQRQRFIERIRQKRAGMEGGAPGGGFPGGGPPGGGFPGGGPPGGGPPGGGFPGGPPGGGEGMPFGPPPGMGDGFPPGPPGFGPPGGGGSGGRQHRSIRNYGGGGGGAPGGPPGGGKMFGRGPLDLTVLNLTADQKSKIQTMRNQNGQKARQLHGQLRQRREAFRDMLFDPAVTNEQILSTRREISKLQNQTEDIMVADFIGIRKLLTKEQMELLPQVKPEEPVRRPRPTAKKKKSQDPAALSEKGQGNET